MEIKNSKKIMVLTIGLIVIFLLVGCWGNHSDKIKINVDFQKEENDWKIISLLEI